MNRENIEALLKVYAKINDSSKDKIDFSAYKVDTDFEEEGKTVNYDFEEDVIDEMFSDLNTLNESIEVLKKIDISQSIETLIDDSGFLLSLIEISSALSNLGRELEEFHNVHVEVLRRLPSEGE